MYIAPSARLDGLQGVLSVKCGGVNMCTDNIRIKHGHIKVEYEIDSMTVYFGEDRHDEAIGIVRCTSVSVESDAEDYINRKVGDLIFNKFAEKEYITENDDWRKEARKDISEDTGVEMGCIHIE